MLLDPMGGIVITNDGNCILREVFLRSTSSAMYGTQNDGVLVQDWFGFRNQTRTARRSPRVGVTKHGAGWKNNCLECNVQSLFTMYQ